MKTRIHFLLAFLFFTATSCEVDVPDTDMIPPKFSFQVRGNGFNHTFQSEDDFDTIELHLRDGYEYSFIFSGGDAGGLEHLSWQWFNSDEGSIDQNVPLENITEGWVARNGGYLWYTGNIEDPRSGTIIAGKFTPHQELRGGTMELSFFARDFGGRNGAENAIAKYMTVVIADHPTQIVPVN